MKKDLIDQSVEYILEHFEGELSVRDVADHFHFSEAYFSRAFKRTTGESVYKFIKRLKMDQSAVDIKLIKDKPITDIGLDYGYSASNYSSAFFTHTRMSKGYAIIGAAAVLALLAVDNILQSPNCPWVLLTAFPLVMWPVGARLGRRLLELPVAIVLSAAGIAAYVALNMFAFPGFLWSMITAYAILWWPLAVYYFVYKPKRIIIHK